MTHDADILIVGGGLNGPALALALAPAGLRIAVVDALPEPPRRDAGFDGRAYALAHASTRLLDVLGIWHEVAAQAQPIHEVKACDGRPGGGVAPLFLHFQDAEIEEAPMGHMLEDRYLRRALMDAMARTPGITHRAGKTVTGQEIGSHGATVTLSGGERLTARLLVGCDGRASATAARAGIRRTGWGYGQTALVCAVTHEHAHDGIAHQVFFPGGPLAILPLPGRRSSIVWSEDATRAQGIAALDDDAFIATLRPRFGDFLGEIALSGGRYSYPLSLSLAHEYVAPRLALVGDAAHGIHPLAGQGLNLGLRDVGALAQVIVEAARRGEDFARFDVLERYQRWRRFDTTTLALGMDAMNRLFSNDNPALRLGRDLGMAVVQGMPGLRRRFIREAAGLGGDLPRLLQGRAI